MQSFSQRDPRWANNKLGNSALTIGRYGCTTTCIADLSTYYGDNFDPALAAKKIQYIQGLVIWGSCVFTNFQFWFRQQGRHDQDIKNALADPNLSVILNVANGSHWVVATGYDPRKNLYTIADPWLGDKADMSRYGNNITGAAFFKRKQ